MKSTGMVIHRPLRFAFPDDFDPMWTPAVPEFACAANAVSLMMPIIEPYFVRTVAAAAPDLDGDLAVTTEAYLAQERAHHGQHARYNRLLIARYPGLARIERVMRAVYRGLERRASPGFNLAVVAVSETMAYSAARWADGRRRELFEQADPVAASLFLWHLAEEVEHKSVAHDVHRRVEAKRPWWRLRMLAAMAVALALVVCFVLAGTTVMVTAERRLHNPVAWFRLIRWSVVFAFELLTNLTLSLLPGHHPSDLADPLWYEVWLRSIDDPARDPSPDPNPSAGPTPLEGRATRPTGDR